MKSKNNYSLLVQKKSSWLFYVGGIMSVICLHLCAITEAFAEKAVERKTVAGEPVAEESVAEGTISNKPVIEKPHVKEVVRNKPYSRVVVSAVINGAFTHEIIESIKSGAPVTFTYFVQLERKRLAIWDETVRKIAIKRMVKFNTLRKEYIAWEKSAEDEDEIEFEAELADMEYKGAPIIKEPPGAGKAVNDKPPVEPTTLEPDRFKDIEQLKHWMTHLDKIDLGSIEGLKDKKPYYARVKCEMKTIKLAPPLTTFFSSLHCGILTPNGANRCRLI